MDLYTYRDTFIHLYIFANHLNRKKLYTSNPMTTSATESSPENTPIPTYQNMSVPMTTNETLFLQENTSVPMTSNATIFLPKIHLPKRIKIFQLLWLLL